MAITTPCTGCGATLRVADEHAGASARCPKCQHVFQIPWDAASSSVPDVSPPSDLPDTPDLPNPFGDLETKPNPYQSIAGGQSTIAGSPHRGGTILVLGILGIVCCQIVGPAAWVMGRSDLKAMDAGLMDPEGRGSTQAGMILGIISSVLLILGLLFFVFQLVILFVMGVGAGF